MHCLVQPNQVIHCLFHIIFIKRVRLWILKQSTCTLYPSEILLFKVFINVCKLTGEIPINWSFFLGVWNSVNSLSVSVTDWTLSWSAIQWVSNTVSNKNLALHWRQNSYPDTTLIFLVFSCQAIWRVISSSPLTFRQCFINTPQHLLSLLSKTLPSTCS